jgi:hypothetical protein
MMITLTKECPADDGACGVPDVQQVCTSVFAELRGPSAKVGITLQQDPGIFDSNTLVYGGTGVNCGFDSNGVLVGGFQIRGGGGASSGTCDLHCLNVPNAKTATILPAGGDVINAAVDWLGAPTPPGSKYAGYSYYHEWLATVGFRFRDGTATEKLVAMAPELERFFAEVMKSMQPNI